MQHVEEWSVGGQDSAYFSDRAGTPSRQRGLYDTPVCHTCQFDSSKIREQEK